MAENYYHSSLSGDEIEQTLVGAVRFNTDQNLTTSQKAAARANIGAGENNSTFKILGYFPTLEDLQEWLQQLPQSGDAYGIGTASPYDVYVYDGIHNTWVNNGSIAYSDALIDDNDISLERTWSSTKINTEVGAVSTAISTGLASKQDKITASGILKGDGSAVSAATKGTDYGALSFTVTLTAAGWVNNVQKISNANFLSVGYAYIVSPASGSFVAYGDAKIYAEDVSTDGSMAFNCDTVPTSDLTANIVRVVSA